MAADDGMHGRSIAAFCAQQRAWLELELQDEQDQKPVQLSQKGGASAAGGGGGGSEGRSNTALQGLSVSDVSIGLYGRTVVQFVASCDATATKESSSLLLLLPAHRFTTGDEVEIRPQKSSRSSSSSSSGVVSAVTDASLSVALFPQSSKQKSSRNGGGGGGNNEEESFLDLWDNNNGPFVILARSNVQVHRKLLSALSELETKGVDHAVCGRIIQALFDPTSHAVPAATVNTTDTSSTAVDINREPLQRAEPTASDAATATASSSHLDASQQEAIAFALSSRQPLALIHGPVRVVWKPFQTPR
jgi:hypothetical protein